MAQAYSDNFNRANSTGLGANWTVLDGRFDVVSNQASSATQGTANSTNAAYASLADTSDNYSEIEAVSTAAVNAYARGLSSAADESSLTAYVAAITAAGGTLRLFKLVTGTFTQLGSDVAYTWASGDKIRVSCSGSTISLLLNGVAKVTVTDTAITAGRRVGIRAAALSKVIDNWLGGDVVAGVVDLQHLHYRAAVRRAANY